MIRVDHDIMKGFFHKFADESQRNDTSGELLFQKMFPGKYEIKYYPEIAGFISERKTTGSSVQWM